MQHIDLNTVSRRTGIAVSKLQFCIDDGISDRDWLIPEYGTPPTGMLDLIAAVHVACGAKLIDSGYSPLTAKILMKAIAGFQRQRPNPLNLPIIADAINGHERAVVQISDGTHVRWQIGVRDTSWFRFTPTRQSEPDYLPTIILAVDVARIRDLIRGDSQIEPI